MWAVVVQRVKINEWKTCKIDKCFGIQWVWCMRWLSGVLPCLIGLFVFYITCLKVLNLINFYRKNRKAICDFCKLLDILPFKFGSVYIMLMLVNLILFWPTKVSFCRLSRESVDSIFFLDWGKLSFLWMFDFMVLLIYVCTSHKTCKNHDQRLSEKESLLHQTLFFWYIDICGS